MRLYPSPCGICTRMDENEVFNRMSRQPLVGRLAVTAIPPFWLSTLIFPPIPSSVTPAKDVLTFASPFTFRAVTELLLFSTVKFPFTRSIKTLPKLVFA